MEYELLFFTSVNNENQADVIKKDISEILESSGAKLSGSWNDIGKRKLAYPIKRDTHAFYSWIRFELDDEAKQNIPEIGKRISLNGKVTRHIIVRADEIGKTAPVAPAETRADRARMEKVKAEISKPRTKEEPAKKAAKATLSELDEKLSEILEETPE